jgi:hypothetical protein
MEEQTEIDRWMRGSKRVSHGVHMDKLAQRNQRKKYEEGSSERRNPVQDILSLNTQKIGMKEDAFQKH